MDIHTLKNAHGIEARILPYGATLMSLKTPDRDGRLADIVLGFDTAEPYLAGTPHLGAVVGRYANRIAQGRFTLDGKTYQLPRNSGPNTLHGGTRGFDKRVWTCTREDGEALRLTYVSADGEEGFPGTLSAHVTYRLCNDGTLTIGFEATTDAATVVNLAHHAYFNLTGDAARPILDHVLRLDASRFTPVDATLIPTGELRDVTGTPFDFREPTRVGDRIGSDDEQLRRAGGYDHNWVLDKPGPGALATAALVSDPMSGRTLEVRTTQPGVQFYTGNSLKGAFAPRTALCLETQHFPDSPNRPDFPSAVLRPGQVYSHKTVLVFGVDA